MAATLNCNQKKEIDCMFENTVEVQRRFRRKFQKERLKSVTVTRVGDFEADGSVRNVPEERRGRPETSTKSSKDDWKRFTTD